MIKKNIIIDTEIYDKVKDYSKNRNRVNSYYEICKLLSEAGSVYGENIIGKYSEKLVNEVGSKYNERTLRRIRQFYIIFFIIIFDNIVVKNELELLHS